MENIGKNYFNPNKKIEYPKFCLEIWPGYITSINQINKKMFANVDLSFKVIRKMSALTYFKELMQTSCKENIRHLMIGQTIMTQYNNRMYIIDDLDFTINAKDTFNQNNQGGLGESISYIDYY